MINLPKFFAITITFLVLLVTIESVNQWSNFKIGNTLFWWICNFILTFCFIRSKKYFHTSSNYHIWIKIYFCWVVICILRGLFTAENYWELKALISYSFVLLLPSVVFITSSKKILSQIISSWFKYVLPLFLIFFLFLDSEAYGRYLVPVNFMVLFYPALSNRLKFTVLVVSFFIVVSDFTARSNVIKTIIPFLYVVIYYFKPFQNIKFLKLVHILMFISPIALVAMGLTNTFNVLKIDEYVTGTYTGTGTVNGEGKELSLTADTRTFLYSETILSAIKNNYVLFGRTPARGYDSEHFGDHQEFELKTGKRERFASEVSIMNIFTWMGLVGVFLYMLVFYKASRAAIINSNNIYIKIVGLYIGFRFLYAFIEDFSRFDLSNIFLWILIGMCFSQQFRKMTNREFKNWFKNIFKRNLLLFRYE